MCQPSQYAGIHGERSRLTNMALSLQDSQAVLLLSPSRRALLSWAVTSVPLNGLS